MNPNATPSKSPVYVVGTDEAGYGPNLGPLLVAASCWTLQTEPLGDVETLRRAFSPSEKPSSFEAETVASSKVKTPSKSRRTKKKNEIGAASLFDLLPDDEASNAPSSANVDSKIDVVSLRVDAVVPSLNDSVAELCARCGV
ncbi:MAG: hypothetical protein IJN32_01640, partial [Thermoguttaceae bacterium]|nr:hypothetical protein [Thermoguttaceae bacterium]